MVQSRMLLLACVAVSVSGHGYVESPPSRNYGCRTGLNSGCGSVQYEPQSVEGPDGWPSGGPSDGTVAAAGRSNFGQLNAQTPSRWGKTAISSGTNVFTWRFTAVHRTRDYRYYITRVGWNQNAPLGTSSFDTTPFCVVDGGMQLPSNPTSHSCTVPTRSGYHVVLAVWDVGDTPASFYNAIDVTIGGAGPTPPVPVPTPPTPTVPVPTPPVPTPPTPPVPTPPPSGGCSGGAGVALWGNCRAAPHCCASGATCYEQSDCFAQCKPSCSRADGWTCRVLGGGPVTVPVPTPPTPPTPTAPVPVPTVPVPTPPTAPVPAPVPTVSGSRSDSRMIAFLGNWQACPTDAQLEHYTHIMISFAVTYRWSASKNLCDASCNIGAPVPVCANQAHPDLVARWRAAGKKVVVSFGGAGMGGSWAGDVNDCWDYCFGKEAHVVSQLKSIVAAQNFDGVDIDYEYFYENGGARGFTRGAEAQTFLREVTVGLKQQLPAGSLVTHAPMEPDVMPGRGYYNVMKETAASVDFVMPQYYNANSRPALDGLAGGSGRISAGDHFRTLVDNVFGGDATRVVFGFCISDCSGTGSNANAAAGVRVMQELAVQHPCNGGAFFWVVKDDTNGDWSGTVGAVVEATRGCSSGGAPTPPVMPVPPPTPPTPTVPVPVPTPPTPTAPVPVPTPPASNCGAPIRKWNRCLGKESCCAAGLSCTGTRWWKSCK